MLYLTGADLVAAAALRAGCDFFAGYPITPASSILKNMLAWLPRAGGVGVQAEDEISSISMCIAASMAGRRAMTATSGPGMSLYSENIGLAQMAEVPLVIVDVQRMGPATGGATTNAEGDVQFARWISSGGYPLVIYAPHDLPSTYRLTLKSFDTAARLRTPVILLTSKNLVMTSESVPEQALESVPVAEPARGARPWLPYQSDGDGVAAVPPLLLFGEDLTRLTTSIHDERGVITESPAKAKAKLVHLQQKVDARRGELCDMEVHGPPSDDAIVCYGSPARSALQARRQLAASGRDVRVVVLHTLSPLPDERLREALHGARRVLVPELNPGLMRPEVERIAAGCKVRAITRVDGALITPEAMAEEVARA